MKSLWQPEPVFDFYLTGIIAVVFLWLFNSFTIKLHLIYSRCSNRIRNWKRNYLEIEDFRLLEKMFEMRLDDCRFFHQFLRSLKKQSVGVACVFVHCTQIYNISLHLVYPNYKQKEGPNFKLHCVNYKFNRFYIFGVVFIQWRLVNIQKWHCFNAVNISIIFAFFPRKHDHLPCFVCKKKYSKKGEKTASLAISNWNISCWNHVWKNNGLWCGL